MRIRSTISFLTLITCAPLALGCGEDAEAPTTREVTIEFAGVVGDEPFSCAQTYALGEPTQEVQITDFKLYVHDVELIRADGERVPVALTSDEVWQAEGVALLDFEDGTGACANGNAPTNTAVRGVIEGDADDFTGVAFTLGIPFELNHADVGALPSPLNLPNMFWSWQGGRKFVRVDGKVGDSGARFHLGSTGCQGEQTDITSCSAPNRSEIVLEGIDPLGEPVGVDLAALFAGVDLTVEEGRSAVCMSEPDTPECGPMFGAVGLEYAGTGGQNQSFFRAMSSP